MNKMKVMSGVLSAICLVAFGMQAQADLSAREKLIQDRIKPVGDVYLDGQAPQMKIASAALTPEDIYKGHCIVCHQAGVAGAPKFGNKDDWAPRVAQGMDTLFNHALHGFNAMPMKGTCMDCSDADIKATVEYMVEHSK